MTVRAGPPSGAIVLEKLVVAVVVARRESFNGKLWDDLLKRESFDTVLEAKVLAER